MRTVQILLLVLLSLCQCKELALSYIVEHELDQADNYVEVSLTLTVEGPSLNNCIYSAKEIIKDIKDISKEYCLSHAKTKDQKKDCGEIVEVSKYQIEPKYINLRKVLTFSTFFLHHEIVIEVQDTQGLGRLIDQILSAGRDSLLLEEISWKAHKEQDPQRSAIREGITQGKQLCQKFGKKLKDIISIFELEHQEEQEEEERDEDLAQEEIQYSTMRFKVICDDHPSA